MPKPPEADPAFVEVLTVYDEPLLPVVRSILEDSGIPFHIRNEATQNLIGAAPRVNPARVMVEAARADEARELLQPVAQPLDEDADVEVDPGTG